MAESSPPAADVLKEGFLTKQGRHNAIVNSYELYVCHESIYVREIPRDMRPDHILLYMKPVLYSYLVPCGA